MDKVFVIGRDALPEKVSLGAGESLRWTLLMLPGLKDFRADVQIDLCGEGAGVDIAGLYLCPQDEKVSLNV
ncbi:MAG: hypothetical protein KBS67_06240, partial [Bacteroidales bacterium]|nr:hypothetical protein [Candidatus Cryptobacteroides equifaecalis]